MKRKDFTRWQAGEKLSDDALCKAVKEMEAGSIDADLGGFLFKKRVARPGVPARAADTGPLQAGVLVEVHCVQQAH